MLGVCFLVAAYADEYKKQKRESPENKRSWEMSVRASGVREGRVTEENEKLLSKRDV
jgi:hypothetical protein